MAVNGLGPTPIDGQAGSTSWVSRRTVSTESDCQVIFRGSGVIVVTGYGDADSSEPSAQATALSVGLARAAAIADALKADGVPASAVRVNAEASGRGASLRLLQ